MDSPAPGDGRTKMIAVVGDGWAPPGSIEATIAFEVGRALVDRGYRLVTGGLGGVMEAASRGGRSSPAWKDGAIVGILPGHDPGEANPYVDIAIPTGLDVARNIVVAHADALIAIGGGAGTLSEIALAWQMQRLILAYRGSGWSGCLADRRVDDRTRYEDIPDDRVYGFDTAEESVRLLELLLPRYRPVWSGVVSKR